MNHKKFFDVLRQELPDAVKKDSQIKGIELLLKESEKFDLNIQKKSYTFGTVYWETAKTFEPVEEAFWLSENWRKTHLRYYPWHGRGYVQLTWEANYKKMEELLGVPLTKDPTLAMVPEIAAAILFVGMIEGTFTGKSYDSYIDDIDDPDDEEIKEYINARRIINGVDKAKQIAQIALKFERAFLAAQE